MAFVFARKLTAPLWTLAFCVSAVTAPPVVTQSLMPATLPFVMAFTGIVVIVLGMQGGLAWWRPSRLIAPGLPSRGRGHWTSSTR